MYHDPDHVPWEEAVHVASCSEGHDAPARGCRCGIYGAVEGVLDSLPGYLHDTAYEHDPFAYGEIACTGRVCVDMRGVRAERGEILRLALADAVDDGLRARLSARYGVPVGGAESVPDWVTVNARDRGAPPDDVDLALDLDRLDLWVLLSDTTTNVDACLPRTRKETPPSSRVLLQLFVSEWTCTGQSAKVRGTT